MWINTSIVRDVTKLFVIAGLGVVAASAPPAALRPLLAGLSSIGSKVYRSDLDKAAEVAGEWLSETTAEQRYATAMELRSVRIESCLCRGYGVFRRGWPAAIEVTGAEHLRAAHGQGRGVVVWLMSFLDPTPFNLVAASEGFPVSHLSSVTHGISDGGSISQRIVSPIVLRSEIRSLGRRVTFSSDAPSAACVSCGRSSRTNMERSRSEATTALVAA